MQYGYDAAGRMISASQRSISQSFDGDGQLAKRVDNGQTVYYVRSSVLGGASVIEVNQYGQRLRGYVYASGQRIAKQEGGQVSWDIRDVSGTSQQMVSVAGQMTSRVETDPLGTIVENPNPSSGGGAVYNTNPLGFYGTPQAPSMGCRMNGVETPCSMVMSALQSGAAAQCPPQGCTRYNSDANNGQGGFEFYRAYSDGLEGWGAVNSYSNGDGSLGRYSPNAPRPTLNGNTRTDSERDEARRGGSSDEGGYEPGLYDSPTRLFRNIGFSSIRTLQQLESTVEAYERAVLDQAFLDAGSAIGLDKDCAKFLGLNSKRAKDNFFKNVLPSLMARSRRDNSIASLAVTRGNGSSAYIGVRSGFFIDGWFSSTSRNIGPREPRQGRAHTILHEIAHALGRIPDDGHSPNGVSQENNQRVLDNCAKGLAKLPSILTRPIPIRVS
jgi:hypothetical protein